MYIFNSPLTRFNWNVLSFTAMSIYFTVNNRSTLFELVNTVKSPVKLGDRKPYYMGDAFSYEFMEIQTHVSKLQLLFLLLISYV